MFLYNFSITNFKLNALTTLFVRNMCLYINLLKKKLADKILHIVLNLNNKLHTVQYIQTL